MIKFIMILCTSFCFNGCVSYGTNFYPLNEASTYKQTIPCNPKFVIKFDETEINKYKLVGTCKSLMKTKGVYGEKNNALKEIEKCACDNGGDIIQITTAVEEKETRDYSDYNTEYILGISSDRIEAKIFQRVDF